MSNAQDKLKRGNTNLSFYQLIHSQMKSIQCVHKKLSSQILNSENPNLFNPETIKQVEAKQQLRTSNLYTGITLTSNQVPDGKQVILLNELLGSK
jgi:hypothetical protein